MLAPEDTVPVFDGQGQVRSFFEQNRVGSVLQCADVFWSESFQSLLQTIDSTLFDRQGLPRLWLWPKLRPGPGHTTALPDDLTHGRGICDISAIEAESTSFKLFFSALLKNATREVCDKLRTGSGRHPWLEVKAAVVIVNAVRSTRTPFMLFGDEAPGVHDTFIVVLTFRAGVWVALWDEKPPQHRLDGLFCNTPLLGYARGLCLFNTPVCFVTPVPGVHDDLSVNAIVIRYCVSGLQESRPVPATISFNFKPEFWLVRTAHVPPLLRCTVCLGAIRDRKFNFDGSSKHNNDTIKGGGQHCKLCSVVDAQGKRTGRFLICEFCSRLTVPTFPFTLTSRLEGDARRFDHDLHNMRERNDLFQRSSVPQTSPFFRCCHYLSKVPNRVEDVVWTIIHPQEFMKAAQFFLDFTLSATWLQAVAPPLILEAQQRTPILVWDAFFRVYVRNSHCNRAKLAIFAVQFALNLTGMFKPQGKAPKREVFFDNVLPFDRRIDDMITERVGLLTEMAHGLVRGEVLAMMARRLIKYLDGDLWGQVLYCSCTDTQATRQDQDYHVGLKRTRCDGPSLDLGLDGGIEERLSWGAFNAHDTEQVKRLRVYQERLRSTSNNTRVEFRFGTHVNLPQ